MNSTFLFIGGIGGLEILIIFILPGILWLWSLIDCVKGEFKNYDKIVWILLIILLPILGAILYLIIGRNQKV
ncbi:MAG: hypothetical protein E2O83_08935 [Bacteroidetes bacterium]|nr:MAG: hypothetical protein E2O83_08935 [Bacteroidota bacterium]